MNKNIFIIDKCEYAFKAYIIIKTKHSFVITQEWTVNKSTTGFW